MWLVTSPISILKVLCFPHCVAVLTTLSNLSWLFMHEFISGLYSRMFWPNNLVICSENELIWRPPVLFFSIEVPSAMRGLLRIHAYFIICSLFLWKKSLEFSEITLYYIKLQCSCSEKRNYQGQKKVSDPKKLELLTIVKNHIGDGNWTWVLWEGSQWARLTLSHFSSPRNLSLIYKLYKILKNRSLSVPNRMLKSIPFGSNVQNVWCGQLL